MRIQQILRNPIYNGWMRRHRGQDEQRRPAAWRLDPPVDDELWAAVARVRRLKTRGGGPRKRCRVDLLAGLLECPCGRRIRSDGRFADGRHRKLHPGPCGHWGPQARYGDEVWEEPVLAQASSMRLDDASIAKVVAMLVATERPVALDRIRLERQFRELAIDHAEGRVGDDAYIARARELRSRLRAFDEPQAVDVPAKRAVAMLTAVEQPPDLRMHPSRSADLIHAVYERIEVAGPGFVGADLTPEAYAHGLALALPETVMASPAGLEPATGRLEGGCSVL